MLQRINGVKQYFQGTAIQIPSIFMWITPKMCLKSHSDFTEAGWSLNLFCLGGNECFDCHDIFLSGAVAHSGFTMNCCYFSDFMQHVNSFGYWQGGAFLTQCCYGWLRRPIRHSYVSFTCCQPLVHYLL